MYLFETCKDFDTKRSIFLLTFMIVLMSSNLVWALPADSITIKPRHANVNASSIYEITFSIGQEISSNAKIIITFPDAFNLSDVLIAGSTTINGGFKVMVESSKVILQRSGLGRTIAPNEKVNVKFANIRNPSEPADNYKIIVEIIDEKNITIINKEEIIKIIPHQKK